jgi:hypothetical protein
LPKTELEALNTNKEKTRGRVSKKLVESSSPKRRSLRRNNFGGKKKPAGGKELIEIRDERLGKNRRKG